MNSLKILLTILTSTAFLLSCQAQKFTLSSKNSKAVKEFQTADTYYRSGQVLKAETHFRNAIILDPNFAEAYFALSTILVDTKREKEGNDYLKSGLKVNDSFYPYGYKTSADLDKKTGYYESAVTYYNLFLEKNKNGDTSDFSIVRQLRDECLVISYMVKNPVPFAPKNLGPTINTKYMDYHPALSIDDKTLLFCRTEPPTQAPTCAGRNGLYEDFYFAYRNEKNEEWGQSVNAGQPLNSGCNEGTPFITPDGRFLFFTACNREGGLGSCDIYFSKKEGNGWTNPKNLGAPINSKAWESQPSFSSDGRTLYFVSNRAGKRDIYSSELQNDGSWANPIKLGPNVNTAEEDHFPFIHPDNQTLYFVSNGHYSVGGDDIFYSKRQADGTWGKAVNIGYPINSIGNEQAIIVNGGGNFAYITSDRPGGYGDMDIYSFELYSNARPNPVTYFKGIVKDKETGLPLEAAFELISLETGKTVIASASDKINGSFLIALPTNKNYALNVNKTGYLFHSENFSLEGSLDASKPFEKIVELAAIKANVPVVLKNIFFKTNEFALLDQSKVELEKLLDFLNKNSSVKIEIGGHTDNVGSDELNKKLSENRAKSVYTYLVESGVNANRLSYKGYGSSKPIAANTSEEGRAENRRTEFKIIP